MHMASSLFPEKDFSRLLSDLNGYRHIFIDRIRERGWYTLVYDNTDVDMFYCPDLVRKFYTDIDTTSVDLNRNQFLVHLDSGDLLVTIDRIHEVTQLTIPPQHTTPLALIDYMTIMGVQCTELDQDLRASTTFRNVHCVGHWIQRNILGIDHTTFFNRPVLHIIHSLMTQ